MQRTELACLGDALETKQLSIKRPKEDGMENRCTASLESPKTLMADVVSYTRYIRYTSLEEEIFNILHIPEAYILTSFVVIHSPIL